MVKETIFKRQSQFFPLFGSLLLFSLLFSSCSMHWSKALRKGQVQETPFRQKMSATNKGGLLFLPVYLKGKEYLFLFDSGAPTSISKELQKEWGYEQISSGKMVDTDGNRFAIDYIQIDEIKIGGISFLDQTAFVADFNANPILECLEIDGIVGSNLMRFCNWEIDLVKEEVELFSSIDSSQIQDYTAIPFRTDMQFNVLVDLLIDSLKVRNITLDFGSNGFLNLPEHSFNALEESKAISAIATEVGWSQSGLSGSRIMQTEKIAIIDSLSIGGLGLENIKVSSGTSKLIGLKALANYTILIDWDQYKLYLKKEKNTPKDYRSMGFSLGVMHDTSFYIQSVYKNSKAEQNGLRPNQKVVALNDFVFNKNATFCDYVSLMSSYPDEMHIRYINEEGLNEEMRLTKVDLVFTPIADPNK